MPDAAPIERVDKILGCDVPGCGWCERTAPDSACTAVERKDSFLDRSKCVRVAGVSSVVEVAAKWEVSLITSQPDPLNHVLWHADPDGVGKSELIRTDFVAAAHDG